MAADFEEVFASLILLGPESSGEVGLGGISAVAAAPDGLESDSIVDSCVSVMWRKGSGVS